MAHRRPLLCWRCQLLRCWGGSCLMVPVMVPVLLLLLVVVLV